MHTQLRRGLTVAAALCAVAGGNALAASGTGSTVTGSASAQIAAPIRLVAGTALQFGTIAQPVTGGTLTMSPQGTLTSTGDMGASSSIAQSGARTAASFTLTGTNGGTMMAIGGVGNIFFDAIGASALAGSSGLSVHSIKAVGATWSGVI